MLQIYNVQGLMHLLCSQPIVGEPEPVQNDEHEGGDANRGTFEDGKNDSAYASEAAPSPAGGKAQEQHILNSGT